MWVAKTIDINNYLQGDTMVINLCFQNLVKKFDFVYFSNLVKKFENPLLVFLRVDHERNFTPSITEYTFVREKLVWDAGQEVG